MNVLAVERGVLAQSKSTFLFGDKERTRPFALQRAVFVSPLPSPLPPMFKTAVGDATPFGQVFVTDAFAKIAIEHQLSGIELADPSENEVDESPRVQ